MLTPVFNLEQNSEFLVIYIKAPYTKISETEIHIDDTEFTFYSKPYYLRLHLPGSIVEDGRETAKYKADKGEFVVKVPKATAGQHFEGLDLLTKLLAPPGDRKIKQPLIEVLDSDTHQHEDSDEEEEFEWYIEQQPCNEGLQTEGPKYGFANQKSGVFHRLQEELHDVIDLKDADSVPATGRAAIRQKEEKQQFSEEHYLGDLYEDDAIDDILKYKPPWISNYSKVRAGEKAENIITLTDDEREKMLKLPRKEYLLNSTEEQQVYLGLIDILFAYAYNFRVTEGENTVESGWTICKLSATLSWLQSFHSLHDVVTCCVRRCLTYPLYRHWALAQKVLQDTRKILALGKKQVLQCLLEIHSILSEGESRYILNELYVTDYCVWIQTASDKQLESLAKHLKKVHVTKKDVDLDLEELELAASLTLEEESQGKDTEQLTEEMSQISLGSDTAQLQENETSSVDLLADRTGQMLISQPGDHEDILNKS